MTVDAYSTFAIIVGLVLLLFTKWQWLDSTVALVFAVIILITGYKVVRKSLAGIMDEADEKLLGEVISFLQSSRRPQWIDMHNMRVIQYGDMMHVDAHMTLPWYYRVADGEREIHLLEDIIADHFGNKIEIFVHIDACAPFSCKLCALTDCPVRQERYKEQLVWTLDIVWADSKHGKASPANVSAFPISRESS
jgi:divalent metal cation (Fe/Co/Zn/Cd) transporter